MQKVKIKGVYKFELDLVIEEGVEIYSPDEMYRLVKESFDDVLIEDGVENLQSTLLMEVR